MPPLRAAIFDLDGTLIDSTEAIVASYQHVFDRLGRKRPSRGAIIETIGHPLPDQLRLLGISEVEEAVAIYRPYYREIARAQTFLLPEAAETLARFREAGWRIGLATSKRRDAAEMLLAHLGVLHYFEAVVGPEDVRHPKPHPECLWRCVALLGVERRDAWYFGDMHFDVMAGRAAGVCCAAVATGYCTRAELEALQPDAVFDTLGEAREHVLRIAAQQGA